MTQQIFQKLNQSFKKTVMQKKMCDYEKTEDATQNSKIKFKRSYFLIN